MTRRREFLKIASSAGTIGLAGYTDFAINPFRNDKSGIGALPVTINVNHPQPAIINAHNFIGVTVSIDEGGLLSSPELHDPTISLEIGGATIERLLPGTFPINAQTTGGDPSRATGTGILTPWDSDMEAVFTTSIVPTTLDSLPLSITLGGRTEVDGDYHEGTITKSIDVISPSPNSLTQQDILQTAEHRADVTTGFGTFLSQQETFTDAVQTAMKEAVYGITIDGVKMLAKDTATLGLGHVSDSLAYTGELVIAYKDIHNYHVAGELSDKPINEVDKEEYGLPFISSVMQGGDDLLEVFDWQVQNFGRLGRRELGAAIVLMHALTEAAEEESVAWQEGNEQRARELLGEQLFFITGDLAETELDDVHSRFSEHITEEVEELHMDFQVDDFSDILLAPNGGGLAFYLPLLRRYRSDHPEYGPDFEYTTRVIERFLEGEGKRIEDLLVLLETENGGDDQEYTVTVNLVDSETGEPIANGTVLLWPNRMGHGWGPKVTDSNGVVTFENLGEVHSFENSSDLEVAGVRAHAAGYTSTDRRDLSWRPNDGPLDITLEMEAENRDIERSILTVMVDDSDYPEIPSVTVEQNGDVVVTERINSRGRAQFSLEDGAEYTVSADGVSETRTVTVDGNTEITLSNSD